MLHVIQKTGRNRGLIKLIGFIMFKQNNELSNIPSQSLTAKS